MTIAEVEAEVALCLAENDEASGRRLAFRFVEKFGKADEIDCRHLVEVAPLPTGDRRYDAMPASWSSIAATIATWFLRPG
ncbi:MAG TPA: hypothetical protein VG244_00030 [Acidimicrobiales bacterium]|nr:hypothetical protein [Acidimicrobiales bacterium]